LYELKPKCHVVSSAALRMARNMLTVAVILTCLSVCGDAYVLPDDLLHAPTRRHGQRIQKHRRGLDVIVKPEYAVMYRTNRVHINCTVTSATTNEQAYISFFVSLPHLHLILPPPPIVTHCTICKHSVLSPSLHQNHLKTFRFS